MLPQRVFVAGFQAMLPAGPTPARGGKGHNGTIQLTTQGLRLRPSHQLPLFAGFDELLGGGVLLLAGGALLVLPPPATPPTPTPLS